MKKICFIFESLRTSNGVAKAAIALANLLAESGEYEVDLMPVFKCEKQNKFNIAKGVSVRPVLGFYFKGLAKFLDLIPDRFLYKMIIRKQYDIEVGFQFGLYTKIISASTNQKAKHIAWMHGYDYGLKLRDYYPLFDKVLCVSRANAEKLQNELNALGLSANIDYCYNVIDDNFVCSKGEEAVETSLPCRPLFVTVGRFSPEKGFPRLLSCLIMLIEEGYRFTMWFVGDGVELEKCKELLEKHKALKEYCIFLGAKENPHKYTSKADLFLCPSYSEGYSNACTEAIMLGVPVLSTLVPGANEIIEDAQAGDVVGNDDKALYLGIKKVLDNQNILNVWKDSVASNRYLFSKAYRSNRVFTLLKSL